MEWEVLGGSVGSEQSSLIMSSCEAVRLGSSWLADWLPKLPKSAAQPDRGLLSPCLEAPPDRSGLSWPGEQWPLASQQPQLVEATPC